MKDEIDQTSKPADPQKARELWLDIVRPAADRGKLEKIPTQLARTPREKAQALNQKYWLSKKSFGAFHPNYDLIRWN